MKQVPKEKTAKPKKPRRRRQRIADSEVVEKTVNLEIQEDKEEQEVTIVGFSSNTRSQQASSPQAGKCNIFLYFSILLNSNNQAALFQFRINCICA